MGGTATVFTEWSAVASVLGLSSPAGNLLRSATLIEKREIRLSGKPVSLASAAARRLPLNAAGAVLGRW